MGRVSVLPVRQSVLFVCKCVSMCYLCGTGVISVCVINMDTFAVFLVDLHGHVAEEIL